MKVIGLHGRRGSPIDAISDYSVCTPGGRYADRVQELHIKIIHLLIEMVERKLFPEIYPEDQSPSGREQTVQTPAVRAKSLSPT
jgi:D-sedoheptulose 7-phosphate isomerase